MKNPLRSPEEYELFVYTLAEQFPSILHSTITFVRRGKSLARVAGELIFDQEIRLIVRERILFDRLPGIIDWYGYEIWRGQEKLYWYDSQPHPHQPDLQSTYPHHKHVPPNVKHNRIPAMTTFTRPNFDFLIREIEAMLKKTEPGVE
ncbi:MAG: DUF6516 family protein [Desulfobacterales bacterium]|nr:DUF6516 family protein [Desulfobacterales bacterium]